MTVAVYMAVVFPGGYCAVSTYCMAKWTNQNGVPQADNIRVAVKARSVLLVHARRWSTGI